MLCPCWERVGKKGMYPNTDIHKDNSPVVCISCTCCSREVLQGIYLWNFPQVLHLSPFSRAHTIIDLTNWNACSDTYNVKCIMLKIPRCPTASRCILRYLNQPFWLTLTNSPQCSRRAVTSREITDDRCHVNRWQHIQRSATCLWDLRVSLIHKDTHMYRQSSRRIVIIRQCFSVGYIRTAACAL